MMGTETALGAFDDESDVVDGVRKRRVGMTTSNAGDFVDDLREEGGENDDDGTTSSRSISPLLPLEMEYRLLDGKDGVVDDLMPIDDGGKSTTPIALSLSILGCRTSFTRRQSGILASVVGGKR